MVAEISLELSAAVFLDTSLVLAATVEAHPSHATAAAFVDELVSQSGPLCISPQICREFLVVLTRQPVSGCNFTRRLTTQSVVAF